MLRNFLRLGTVYGRAWVLTSPLCMRDTLAAGGWDIVPGGRMVSALGFQDDQLTAWWGDTVLM